MNFLSVDLSVPSYLSFTVQSFMEGPGALDKSIRLECGAPVLKAQSCAWRRHRHVVNSTRSFGFVAGIHDLPES